MSAKKSKVRLKKEKYTLVADFKTSEKSYKKGDEIALTPQGRAYLKSIHKI